MYTDHGQTVDLADVREAIERADVLIVGFAALTDRLLVDSRTTDESGPMVRVVEPLGGVEERMFWLGQNRPAFGMPERFTFFVWPHTLEYLESSGVSDTMRRTVAGGDGPRQFDEALHELQRLERAARRAAVDGRPWRTVWHVSGKGTRRGG